MASFAFSSGSIESTHALGVSLGKSICHGITIMIDGELGAGKTHLVRGIAEGLKADPDTVNSPTFVLMQTYPGPLLTLCHFDTYRLGDVDEFLAIGAEEYLHDDTCVCVIEWAERVEEILPQERLQIRITQSGESRREFMLQGIGDQCMAIVEATGREIQQHTEDDQIGPAKAP